MAPQIVHDYYFFNKQNCICSYCAACKECCSGFLSRGGCSFISFVLISHKRLASPAAEARWSIDMELRESLCVSSAVDMSWEETWVL